MDRKLGAHPVGHSHEGILNEARGEVKSTRSMRMERPELTQWVVKTERQV